MFRAALTTFGRIIPSAASRAFIAYPKGSIASIFSLTNFTNPNLTTIIVGNEQNYQAVASFFNGVPTYYKKSNLVDITGIAKPLSPKNGSKSIAIKVITPKIFEDIIILSPINEELLEYYKKFIGDKTKYIVILDYESEEYIKLIKYIKDKFPKINLKIINAKEATTGKLRLPSNLILEELQKCKSAEIQEIYNNGNKAMYKVFEEFINKNDLEGLTDKIIICYSIDDNKEAKKLAQNILANPNNFDFMQPFNKEGSTMTLIEHVAMAYSTAMKDGLNPYELSTEEIANIANKIISDRDKDMASVKITDLTISNPFSRLLGVSD